MPESRRNLLLTLLGAAGVLAAEPWLSAMQMQNPQPRPSPNAPNPNFPPGLNGPDIRPGSGKKAIDQQNQIQIRADIQKLYNLAAELKEEVEKTNANSTLSISVVKKAQTIEKLAKQIKDRAKG